MTMPDYIPIDRARDMPGLRIAFTRGVPGPWGVAARSFFDFKGIDYVAVAQDPGAPNEELKDWTGQTSAPVAMLDNERPRAIWSELLVLAEQMQPEPRLIPADEDERMTMFGLCHEMCSDDGLGWNARHLALSAQRAAKITSFESLHTKYSSLCSDEQARDRVTAIIDALARRLERQAQAGSRYFVGTMPTAADFYWMGFSNLFASMSPELCTMPDFYRGMGAVTIGHRVGGVPQILLDHRDHMARTYCSTPIVF